MAYVVETGHLAHMKDMSGKENHCQDAQSHAEEDKNDSVYMQGQKG